jgi:hypothetical protein
LKEEDIVPNVRVKYLPKVFRQYIWEIRDSLREIVANALTCDDAGGQLVPNDIEVKMVEMTDSDIFNYALGIDISAMFFPSRMANLEERRSQIEKAIVPLLFRRGLKFYACVELSPTAWGESVSEVTPEKYRIVCSPCQSGDHQDCTVDPVYLSTGSTGLPCCCPQCHPEQSGQIVSHDSALCTNTSCPPNCVGPRGGCECSCHSFEIGP